MNHCGTCTACCNVFAIPPLEKPAGKWCQHCTIGTGCNTYNDRPRMCVEFECLWLQSQKQPDPRAALPPEMRPDRCRVVFSPTTNETIIAAITLSPDAWVRKGPRALIANLVKRGFRVSAGPPAATDLLLIDKDGAHKVKMSEPDANGMQWRIDGGA